MVKELCRIGKDQAGQRRTRRTGHGVTGDDTFAVFRAVKAHTA